MNKKVKIGIIGDYDGRPSHVATEESVRHCANRFGMQMELELGVELEWVATASLLVDVEQILKQFDGIWCAPGSPYKSMAGAINGIAYARRNDVPFIGTCGGFQHAVLEFGRNVLQIQELQAERFDPYGPNDYITALSCSLIGQSRQIHLDPTSVLSQIYGQNEITEQYNCSFGLDKDYQAKLEDKGFRVVGLDNEGEARIMTLPQCKFYVVTLFQPQLSSTPDKPHPLIMEYIKSII